MNRTGMGHLRLTVFAALALCLPLVHGLRFHIPANGKRCIKEEIHKHTLVKGEYELEDVRGHHTAIKVRFYGIV